MTAAALNLFGHHPDKAIDWSIECEELENIVSDYSLGLKGFGHEEDYARLGLRLARFLDFMSLDPHIRNTKHCLRRRIKQLGYNMSPKRYEGDPVILYRAISAAAVIAAMKDGKQ